MNTFQKTVLTISIVVLIFSLIILGLFLAKSLFEDSYPPVISDCPDYWDVSYNVNDEVVCKNTSTINNGRDKMMIFYVKNINGLKNVILLGMELLIIIKLVI
jgi:hypothetical protein